MQTIYCLCNNKNSKLPETAYCLFTHCTLSVLSSCKHGPVTDHLTFNIFAECCSVIGLNQEFETLNRVATVSKLGQRQVCSLYVDSISLSCVPWMSAWL